MKHWMYKGIIFLLFFSLVKNGFAENRKDFTKTIKKEFDITKNGKVEIENKFGKVEINTWDENRVKITVTVIVRADSEKEAQPIFERIAVNFSNGRDYVEAKTEIESQSSSWWGCWNCENDSDYAINYLVYMPETARLDLSNKHGEAITAKLMGSASISIAHGNITAEGFDEDLELELAHSNGTILTAKALRANLSHSNIRFKTIGESDVETAHCNIQVDKMGTLRLDSRHTNFEIGEINELRADSHHDNFEIRHVNVIFSEAEHSIYDIDRVGKSIDFDFAHGGADINYLEAGFQEVNLHGSHADYHIQLAKDANYQLNASGSHAGISYPRNMNVTYESDKNNEREVKGHSGNVNTKGFGLIKAQLSHGGLRIE